MGAKLKKSMSMDEWETMLQASEAFCKYIAAGDAYKAVLRNTAGIMARRDKAAFTGHLEREARALEDYSDAAYAFAKLADDTRNQ